MASSEQVKEMFSASRGASQWDDMYKGKPSTFEQHIFTTRRNYALDFVANNFDQQSSILDLGCGAGPFVSELLRHGYQCVATDYSADILANAVKRIESIPCDRTPLAQSDCQFIPFASQAFDAVVCLGVISYVPDRSKALGEMSRILAPDGQLLITFRNYYNPVVFEPLNWLKGLFGKVIPSIHAEHNGEFVPGAFLKPQAIKCLLEKAGLEVMEQYGIGRGPLRVAGHVVFPEKVSIVLDTFLQRCLSWFGLSSRMLGADVVLYRCKKKLNSSRSGN